MPIAPPMMDPGGGGPGAGGLSGSDVIRIFKQRIFLIIFIWMVVMGATVWGTWYLDKYYPKYRSAAAVVVQSPLPKTPLELAEQQVGIDIMDRFVADQIEAIRNDKVLFDALATDAVQKTDWYQENDKKYDSKFSLVTQLKEELSIGQVPDTNYVQIVLSTRKADDAPVIINQVVTLYLDALEQRSRESYGAELNEYRKEETRIYSDLERVRRDKQEFLASELASPGIAMGVNVVGEQWNKLASVAVDLEMQKLMYKSIYDSLASVDASQIAISPQMQLLIQSDPVVATLNTQLFQREQLRRINLARFGENHRIISSIDREVEVLQNQLNEVLAEKEQEVRQYQIHQAEMNYLSTAGTELSILERVKEKEFLQRDLDEGMAKYRDMEEVQLLLEDQYRNVRAFINQLLMLMSDPRNQVRVRSVQKAEKNEQKHFPQWRYFLPAGAFMGLLMGFGMAMLLEIANVRIRTTRDIVRHAHVPILGTVPHIDYEEVPIDDVELAMHMMPRSITAEAFRSIRTNLLLSAPAESERSIVVTSAKPEEGKTSVAANLAIALAQSGRHVLLVDANLHRPRLSELFPQANKDGLSSILIGRGELSDLASQTEIPNLSVLSSGPIPPNPTELLAGSYFQTFLKQATERYDQVILDAPPVLLVADAMVMAGEADGVILVCRANKTLRGVVLRAREQIEQVNGRIFGAVLNMARVARGGYFREQIRTYYDYQTEGAAQAGDAARWLPREQGKSDEDEQL